MWIAIDPCEASHAIRFLGRVAASPLQRGTSVGQRIYRLSLVGRVADLLRGDAWFSVGCHAINGQLKVPAMARLVRPVPYPEAYDKVETWDARVTHSMMSAWGKEVRENQTATAVWAIPRTAAGSS